MDRVLGYFDVDLVRDVLDIPLAGDVAFRELAAALWAVGFAVRYRAVNVIRFRAAVAFMTRLATRLLLPALLLRLLVGSFLAGRTGRVIPVARGRSVLVAVAEDLGLRKVTICLMRLKSYEKRCRSPDGYRFKARSSARQTDPTPHESESSSDS
jgi:hypothetical protein